MLPFIVFFITKPLQSTKIVGMRFTGKPQKRETPPKPEKRASKPPFYGMKRINTGNFRCFPFTDRPLN
jgi:hypothetical protein